MKINNKIMHDKRVSPTTLLILCMVIGAIFRFVNIDWGLPAELQSDEFIEVYGSLGMAMSHSTISDIFNQPNHLSMVINSLVFQIFSFIVYGISPAAAFDEHKEMFWLLCRCYGALTGMLSILLVYLILSYHSSGAAVCGAAMTALFPAFIVYSHFTLPDIPLVLAVLCVIYFSIRFLHTFNLSNFMLICFISGISITIKYPGALTGLLIFYDFLFLWIQKSDIKRRTAYILSGLIAFLLAIMIFAPAILIDWKDALLALQHEASVIHIGADGGDYFWKLRFYAGQFLHNTGWLFLLPLMAGIWYVIKSRRTDLFPLFWGFIYCLCLSALQLHWERWALPMYTAPLLLGSIGIAELYQELYKIRWHRVREVSKVVLFLTCSIIGVTMFTQAWASLVNFSMPDTRVVSNRFCAGKGINKDNSIYQSNTPLAYITDTISEEYNFYNHFISENGEIRLRTQGADKKYVVLSSNMYMPYSAEPERYAYRLEVIERIKTQFPLIAEYRSANYTADSISYVNILKNVYRYYVNNARFGMRGPLIDIYQIPEQQ